MMTRVGVLVTVCCLLTGLNAYPGMAQEGGDAQHPLLSPWLSSTYTLTLQDPVPHAGDCLVVTPSYVLQKIVCPVAPLAQEGNSVTWLGWVVAGEERESASLPFPGRPEVKAFYNIVDHHKAYQLGLRADGVVVWRPMPKETPDGR
jgi:hypothetical protein